MSKCRKALGFTQDELSIKMGYSKGYYSAIESGKKKGTVDFWLKLQDSLALTNNELVEFMREG